MAVGILMPKAGISVESCIVGAWRKQVGDDVSIGDILFDYETDKATFECESTAQGVLLAIFYETGDEVPCLTVVCAVGQAGEDVSDLRPLAAAAEAAPTEVIQTVAIVQTSQTEATGAASPRAKNLARRMKVDINAATPSGPRGRIIARDVLAAAQMADGEGIGGRGADGYIGGDVQTGQAALTVSVIAADYTDEKFTPIRKAVARSMSKSLAEIPQLTHHHSCDAAAMLALRRRFKAAGGALSGITLGDMVLFAVARTLAAHPDLNSHLLDNDTLRKYSAVHLGMAVDTPRGLMVPTIFNADGLSLLQLSAAVKELAGQAKSGGISPDLLQGASFTVSNLGALGVEMFTPVINPPQVGILGVCGIVPKIREADSNIEVFQSMGLSLTYDHRAVDGAPASRFARDLAQNLENFDLLMAY